NELGGGGGSTLWLGRHLDVLVPLKIKRNLFVENLIYLLQRHWIVHLCHHNDTILTLSMLDEIDKMKSCSSHRSECIVHQERYNNMKGLAIAMKVMVRKNTETSKEPESDIGKSQEDVLEKKGIEEAFAKPRSLWHRTTELRMQLILFTRGFLLRRPWCYLKKISLKNFPVKVRNISIINIMRMFSECVLRIAFGKGKLGLEFSILRDVSAGRSRGRRQSTLVNGPVMMLKPDYDAYASLSKIVDLKNSVSSLVNLAYTRNAMHLKTDSADCLIYKLSINTNLPFQIYAYQSCDDPSATTSFIRGPRLHLLTPGLNFLDFTSNKMRSEHRGLYWGSSSHLPISTDWCDPEIRRFPSQDSKQEHE
ncbi:hypothetical protein C0J52_13826, partial [Blattella germanica]